MHVVAHGFIGEKRQPLFGENMSGVQIWIEIVTRSAPSLEIIQPSQGASLKSQKPPA
jgi:hypothetical protein